MTNKKSLKTIVVYTRAPWENALVKLRITAPAELAGINVLNGKEGGTYHPELVTQADIVVIQRDFPLNWKAYKNVLDIANTNNKPVIYEMDDLLLDMPNDHSHRHEYVHALLPMLDAALRSDVVTVSTRLLAEYMRQWNPNTRIIPNYLDDHIWDFNRKNERTGTNEQIFIGYMGGETHLLDLQYISEAIVRILDKYTGKIRLRIWGGKPPDVLVNSSYCEWVPINQLNYALFAKFFSQQDCDIFIAPLRDNRFNRSKSEIKFLEYGVHGVPGIYSQLPPYESIVIHGQNGYLASTIDEWEECLVKLIENPKLRQKMGSEAQITVKDGWLLSQNNQGWLEAYQSALNPKAEEGQVDPGLFNLLSVIQQSIEYNNELIESVGALTEQVEDILESRSWRMMKKFQNIRLKLIPPGGSGERMLNSVFGKSLPKS